MSLEEIGKCRRGQGSYVGVYCLPSRFDAISQRHSSRSSSCIFPRQDTSGHGFRNSTVDYISYNIPTRTQLIVAYHGWCFPESPWRVLFRLSAGFALTWDWDFMCHVYKCCSSKLTKYSPCPSTLCVYAQASFENEGPHVLLPEVVEVT